MSEENRELFSELGLPVELLEAIPGGFYVCEDKPEEEYPLVYMSERFLEILEWTREEIKERFDNKYSRMLHPDDRKAGEANYSESIDNTKSVREDRVFRMQGKNGYVWVSSTAKICETNGKKYVHAIHTAINNIVDESKQEKMKLQEAKTEVVQNIEILKNQLEIIKSVASVYVCLYYMDMSDYSYIELGSNADDVESLMGKKGDAHIAFEQMCKYLVADEYVDTMREFTEVETVNERLKNTNWIAMPFIDTKGNWTEGWFIAADRDEHGNCNHAIWGVRDISEQKNIELAYQHELEEANNAKTTFLFNMSHEIRTPMNAITGFRDLLEKYQDDPEKRQDYLNKIKYSNEVLLSIINNVLEMTRVAQGNIHVEEIAVNMGPFCTNLESMFSEMMEEKGIKFTVESRVTHQYVFGDPTKVREIFMNLISNAYKYTNPGGRISVVFENLPCDREDYINLKTTIADTGIGMSEEFLTHIFEPFSREQNTTDAKVEGTGLGMPIVKRLTEIMDGTINIKSEKGIGTTIVVTIPHRIATEDDCHEPVIADVNPEVFAGKRILLAEDNDLNAEIAMEILQEAGLVVERAEDGRECCDMLGKASANYYDLILMDIQMPNMNGYEASIFIRKMSNSAKASIPIVAMTANAFEEDKKEAMRCGMNGHLAKPINVKELIGQLAKILR